MYDRACASLPKDEARARISHGESFTVRMKVPIGSTSIEDKILGTVHFAHNVLDDQVMLPLAWFNCS